jgi:LPS-assembly lipoprotein
MSWSRRDLAGLLLLPLAACGFHPMYGREEQVVDEPELAAISVAPIIDRMGQQLELSLREALNPEGLAVKQRYKLFVTLTAARTDLGIQRDATSTRGRISAYVNLQLFDIAANKSIYNSRTQSIADFNILEDAYAAQVAEDDARTRAVRDLTAEIRTRLTLFVHDRPKLTQKSTD